jgi:RimJ/RimL family protein N-acetyltransferase
MDVVGLPGERVRLVPSEPGQHLENALRWFNDPETTARLAVFNGLTRQQAEEFFKKVGSPRDKDLHWAILAGDLGHIGFIALHQIDGAMRSAAGGLIIGERAAWGKGFATDAVRVRTKFAFEQLGLHRIDGHTFNPAMRKVYEKAGYKLEGVARERLWRDGRWHDTYLYSILESDYFSSRG